MRRSYHARFGFRPNVYLLLYIVYFYGQEKGDSWYFHLIVSTLQNKFKSIYSFSSWEVALLYCRRRQLNHAFCLAFVTSSWVTETWENQKYLWKFPRVVFQIQSTWFEKQPKSNSRRMWTSESICFEIEALDAKVCPYGEAMSPPTRNSPEFRGMSFPRWWAPSGFCRFRPQPWYQRRWCSDLRADQVLRHGLVSTFHQNENLHVNELLQGRPNRPQIETLSLSNCPMTIFRAICSPSGKYERVPIFAPLAC